MRRQLSGEEAAESIVHREQSFLNSETNGSGSEALAQGKEHVGPISAVRVPPAFCHHIAVAENHDGVNLKILVLEIVQ